MNEKGGRKHYAWVILIACCLMQSAITGVVQNGRGIFYNPVCDELGFEVSAFTLYSLFHGIGSFVMMPFAVKLLERFRPRTVLGAHVLLFCGSTALMGRMSTLPGFYIVGFLQGVGSSLLIFYICPLLVANWFEKFYGTAMGIYAAFSGLAGVFINPVLNGIIERHGWRNGYLAQGAIAFAIALPAVILTRALAPEDCGMTKYGQADGAAAGAAAVQEDNSPATAAEKRILVLLLGFTVLSSLINPIAQHFAKYAVTIGFGSAIGAILVSCTMAGNIGGKFLMGVINDRFGARAEIIFSCTAVAIGLAGMLVPVKAVLYPSAALSGITMPICSVGIPMAAKYLYGVPRYKKFYSPITMVTALVSAASITVISLLYEWFGTYPPVFILFIALTVLCAVLFLAAEKLRKE